MTLFETGPLPETSSTTIAAEVRHLRSAHTQRSGITLPDSLQSASKASRQVACQIGLPVGSVRRRLPAHSVALALSCQGLRLKCCCYVAECEIDASVMITTRRSLHQSTSVPKNTVPCRQGRSLPRLVADYATAGRSERARCASRMACRRATCAGACMLRGKRVRARASSPWQSLPPQKRKFPA